MRAEERFLLRDGRQATVCPARGGHARGLRDLLDTVGAENPPSILHLPGTVNTPRWRRDIAEAASSDRRLLLVACIDGRLAGHLVLADGPAPFCVHVCEVGLAVAAAERRLGLGALLLRASLEWALAHGFTRCVASVFPHNQSALGFFVAQGFVREGERPGQWVRAGVPYDEVLMGGALPLRASRPRPDEGCSS